MRLRQNEHDTTSDKRNERHWQDDDNILLHHSGRIGAKELPDHQVTLSEAEAALGRGKQVEQFLGGLHRDDDWIIRYLVIRPEKGTFVVTRYECLDEGDFVGTNIVFFTSALHPDDDPEDFSFSSFDQAVAFAQERFGARTGKFVNQDVCQEEYWDYFLSRSVSHSQKSKYATFNSSLPDDSQEIGNRVISPGLNVASRVHEGLKQRGYRNV